MTKVYNIFYVLNILLGLLLMLMYVIMIPNMLTISLLVIASVVGVYALYKFKKNHYKPQFIDYLFVSIYIVFIITILLVAIIYQRLNTNVFSIPYFSSMLFIPYILMILWDIKN